MNASPTRPHTGRFCTLTVIFGVLTTPVTTRSVAVKVGSHELGEFDVRSQRAFADGGSPVDVTVVGNASLMQGVTSGDPVLIVGVTRRRFFRTGGATVSRTEVEARQIIKQSRKKDVARALSEVAALLDPPT